MFFDDVDAKRREHLHVELGTGFQVFCDNPNVVKHANPTVRHKRGMNANRTTCHEPLQSFD